MALTPYPAKTQLVGPEGLVNQPHWSQWLNALRAAVNITPGNSLPLLFVNLPSPPTTGMILVVTDAMTDAWGDIVAGGGLLTVAAFYNGSNWTVIGK